MKRPPRIYRPACLCCGKELANSRALRFSDFYGRAAVACGPKCRDDYNTELVARRLHDGRPGPPTEEDRAQAARQIAEQVRGKDGRRDARPTEEEAGA
jgi:hypothetical protein